MAHGNEQMDVLDEKSSTEVGNKMKRIGMILLTSMMILSLGACAGGNESAGNGSNAESAQNSAVQPRASEESKTSEESKVSEESKTSEESEMPESAQDQNAAETPSETEAESRQPSETANEPADSIASSPEQEPEGSKILVAYFSATNNTEGVAQKLADGLGADLYEITPEQPYTDEDLDYGNSGSRSSVEMDDPSARPEISGSVENMEQYDVVFIGYPIWWGEAPRIMSTFIESYDFSGKTLVAFCTSASSGFGNSDSALRSATSGAEWLDGHRFSARAESDEVMEWANGLGID